MGGPAAFSLIDHESAGVRVLLFGWSAMSPTASRYPVLFFLGALLLRRLRVLRAIVSVCNNERGQCDVDIKGIDQFVGLCMVLLSESFAVTAATECTSGVCVSGSF